MNKVTSYTKKDANLLREMKKILARSEAAVDEKPYLEETQIVRRHNPRYDGDRLCTCGHTYHRHFDPYDNMYPVGCKYCDCHEFHEHGTKPLST